MPSNQLRDERLSDTLPPGIIVGIGMTQAEVKAALELYNAKRAAREPQAFGDVLWLDQAASPVSKLVVPPPPKPHVTRIGVK